MNYQELFATLIITIAVLVGLVNLLTEIAKKIINFKQAIHINIFVVILSVALTVAVFLAYWQIKQMQITWYLIMAFIVIGFLVAYGAMFGFDKLIKHIPDLKNIISEFKKVISGR